MGLWVQTLRHLAEATDAAHLRRLDREVHASQSSGISRNSQSSRRNRFSIKVILGDSRCPCLEMAVPFWPPLPGLTKPPPLLLPSTLQSKKEQGMHIHSHLELRVPTGPCFCLSLDRKDCPPLDPKL